MGPAGCDADAMHGACRMLATGDDWRRQPKATDARRSGRPAGPPKERLERIVTPALSSCGPGRRRPRSPPARSAPVPGARMARRPRPRPRLRSRAEAIKDTREPRMLRMF